jgi:hypothetical protein
MAGSEVAPLACNSVITGARSAARAAAASALASAPFRAGLRGELGTRTKITQLLATTLGGSKRCLGAIRNKAGLEFGHESHLLQHEAAGRALDLRQIRVANAWYVMRGCHGTRQVGVVLAG